MTPEDGRKKAFSMKKYDIICIGMAFIDSIIRGFDPKPFSASGYRAESGSLNVGGEAVNEAVAASKLGMKAAVLCSVGQDSAGDMVIGTLEKMQMDTSLIIRSDKHATPVTTMFVHEDGTRRSITNQAHTYNFHPEKYAEVFTDARALILGSLFRAPFDDPVIIREVLTAAKAAGQLVFADTKIPNFRFLTLDDIADSLPLLDYITPNEDEARHFTGRSIPEEMADEFLERGVKNVILKLGSAGCLFKNSDMTLRLPALPVEAVDSTGAGDNFVAGFASEILRGSAPEQALRFGNACGAICTMTVGAGTALKNREQVKELLMREAGGVLDTYEDRNQ